MTPSTYRFETHPPRKSEEILSTEIGALDSSNNLAIKVATARQYYALHSRGLLTRTPNECRTSPCLAMVCHMKIAWYLLKKRQTGKDHNKKKTRGEIAAVCLLLVQRKTKRLTQKWERMDRDRHSGLVSMT
jgi:hypothetical protein